MLWYYYYSLAWHNGLICFPFLLLFSFCDFGWLVRFWSSFVLSNCPFCCLVVQIRLLFLLLLLLLLYASSHSLLLLLSVVKTNFQLEFFHYLLPIVFSFCFSSSSFHRPSVIMTSLDFLRLVVCCCFFFSFCFDMFQCLVVVVDDTLRRRRKIEEVGRVILFFLGVATFSNSNSSIFPKD